MDSGAPVAIGGFEERIVATIDGLALYARDYPPLLPETVGLVSQWLRKVFVASTLAVWRRSRITSVSSGRTKTNSRPHSSLWVAGGTSSTTA